MLVDDINCVCGCERRRLDVVAEEVVGRKILYCWWEVGYTAPAAHEPLASLRSWQTRKARLCCIHEQRMHSPITFSDDFMCKR